MKELLDYLGLPGSIATVFLAIMFAFGQIEKLATTTAKSDLSHFLKTANWITISSQLPKIIHELFKRVFGESHFSLKCFYRSVIFTLGSLFTLLMLGFIGNYAYFKTMPFELTYSPSFQVIFMGWLMLSVAVDYANLYKTRVLIRLVKWARLPVLSFIPLIILDLLLSLFVFMLLYGCVFSLSAAHSMCIKAHCTVWEELSWTLANFRCSETAALQVFLMPAGIFARSRARPGPTKNSVYPYILGHFAHPPLEKWPKSSLDGRLACSLSCLL